MEGNFEPLVDFQVAYAPSRISTYRSRRTGMQVVLIDQPSPIVNGYFAVSTEIDNDSGCPHTLEHLVFMGSKNYPYKGLLDTLGNRCYSYTNAWTATDSTVYTLVSAGWEGFKSLLPIYLDHVLHPLITDEACTTEVYHLDGRAKEKGVVFSEMLNVENQAYSLVALEAMRNLYSPASGYSHETGGLTENLRQLSNDAIREFHKLRYRPNNLCLIITGRINTEEFFRVMNEFDSVHAEPLKDPKTHPEYYYRPFVDSPVKDGPPAAPIVRSVDFPDEDESTGELLFSWFGPQTSDVAVNLAVDTVGTYLTDSSLALLQKTLVEIEDPLATDVDYYTDDYLYTGLNLYVSGVPTEKLEVCQKKTLEIIREHVDSGEFSLTRIREILQQSKTKFVLATEKSPKNLAQIAILDFLYGAPDGAELSAWSRTLDEYDELLNWSYDQWIELINQWFLANPPVIVRGKPSKKCYKQLKKTGKERRRAFKKQYGKEGLQQLAEKLKQAEEANNRPIPDEILRSHKLPNPKGIAFIDTISAKSGLARKTGAESGAADSTIQKLVDADETRLTTELGVAQSPLYIHFEHFQSNFVEIRIGFSTADVQPEHLPLVALLFTELFNLPVKLPSGQYLDHEEVISQLKNDTVNHSIYCAFPNSSHPFSELLTLKMQLQVEKYSQAVMWLHRCMYYTVFDKKRVRTAIEVFLNRIPERKRDGNAMMKSLLTRKTMADSSLRKSNDDLFIRDVFARILSDYDSEYPRLVCQLEEIRSRLFQLGNMRILVSGDVERIERPVAAWADVVKAAPSGAKHDVHLTPFPRSFEVLSPLGQSLTGEAFIVSTPGSESAFINMATKIPHDYSHKDIPALCLAAEFLQCVEGPLWRGIRGRGLAYGANMYLSVETGMLVYSVYRAADAVGSIVEAKKTVEEFTSGDVKIDQLLLEGALSSYVNSQAEAESHVFDASMCAYVGEVIKGERDRKAFLDRLGAVTADDVLRVMKEYVVKVFSPGSGCVFAASHTSGVESLVSGLEELQYCVNVETLDVAEEEAQEGEAPSRGNREDGEEDDEDEYEEEYEDEEEGTDSESDSGTDSESGSDSDSDDDSEGDSGASGSEGGDVSDVEGRKYEKEYVIVEKSQVE